MKWEYDIKVMMVSRSNHDAEFVKELNKLGAMGWECYMIEPKGEFKEYKYYRLYLKRQVSE